METVGTWGVFRKKILAIEKISKILKKVNKMDQINGAIWGIVSCI
jgi:hypothetical protein